MKLRMLDMIDRFVEEEVRRAAHRTATRLRSALERFALFVDSRHGGRWRLDEVTEEDGRSFYTALKKEERPARATWQTVMDLDAFMRYAVKEGWITQRPWGKLTGTTTRGKESPMSGKERERMLRFCARMRCDGFTEYRDRALLPLLFHHRIGTTELSKMNRADYDGTALLISSPFAWRCRRINLSDDERRYLDEYLTAREGRTAPGHEDALFLGEKGRRIGPRTVTELRTVYRMKMEEHDEE